MAIFSSTTDSLAPVSSRSLKLARTSGAARVVGVRSRPVPVWASAAVALSATMMRWIGRQGWARMRSRSADTSQRTSALRPASAGSAISTTSR